jgi:hypothetical protein
MTGGSDDARTPHDKRSSVDAGWDELIEESDEGRGDSGRPDARPVSGGHVMALRPEEADDEMARLMAGAAPRLPTIDPDTAELRLPPDEAAQQPKLGAREEPVVASNAGGIAAVEAKAEREQPVVVKTVVAPEAAAVAPKVEQPVVAKTGVAPAPKAEPPVVAGAPMPVERAAPSKIVVGKDALAEAPPKAPVTREEPAVTARASRPSLRVVEVADERAARASRPVETASAAEPEPTRGLPWAWIGIGAIALGAVAYVATREDAPSSGRERTPATTVAERTPQAPENADPDPEAPTPLEAKADDAGSEDDGGADSGDSGGTKPPTPRSKDPREPPPGTPPEIAAVFRRLPVGPGDRAPVGGIGATGIHVDHIAMGSETQGATCRGRSDDFSVSAGDRAGVCVRVVHAREKEELQVLWQKHGGSTRRSKMVVLPMHAYRTRGYLSLRGEYIGDWTVRILSSDDVELARHDFTVVP